MSGENGSQDYRQWQLVMQTKVEEMHDDIHEIKAIMPRLEPLAALPEKIEKLCITFDRVGDTLVQALVGKRQVPESTFNLVTRTLCIVILVLATAFAGAQGWLTKILAFGA